MNRTDPVFASAAKQSRPARTSWIAASLRSSQRRSNLIRGAVGGRFCLTKRTKCAKRHLLLLRLASRSSARRPAPPVTEANALSAPAARRDRHGLRGRGTGPRKRPHYRQLCKLVQLQPRSGERLTGALSHPGGGPGGSSPAPTTPPHPPPPRGRRRTDGRLVPPAAPILSDPSGLGEGGYHPTSAAGRCVGVQRSVQVLFHLRITHDYDNLHSATRRAEMAHRGKGGSLFSVLNGLE